MNITKKMPNKSAPSVKINAASEMGTVYYKTNAEQIIDVLKDNTANAWLIAAFQNDGLDAIDFKHHLYGSYVEGDDLYICVTDGYEIDVNGEEVDPESAFEDYTSKELAAYIQPATPEIILERITEYEIKPPFFDGWAADLLEGGYTFVQLMDDAQEFID